MNSVRINWTALEARSGTLPSSQASRWPDRISFPLHLLFVQANCIPIVLYPDCRGRGPVAIFAAGGKLNQLP